MDSITPQSFTIRFSIRISILLLLVLCFVEMGLVCIAVFTEYRVVGIVFSTINAILCVLVAIISLQFRIQINGTQFAVRTRMGKRFSFDCADICSITCVKKDSIKYGPSFYIQILTRENNNVTVEGTMDGFRQLAGYLLTQLNTGMIPETAATHSCKKELKRYADGEIFPKKRRNRLKD